MRGAGGTHGPERRRAVSRNPLKTLTRAVSTHGRAVFWNPLKPFILRGARALPHTPYSPSGRSGRRGGMQAGSGGGARDGAPC